MPETGFDRLQKYLLVSGVAPRLVNRTISELSDHYEDLEAEAMNNGLSRDEAGIEASTRIGDVKIIAKEILSRPELKCWAHRYPFLARFVLPVAYFLMIPAAPIFAGVAHAHLIGRWCVCLLLSAAVTSSMILVMQIAIAIS